MKKSESTRLDILNKAFHLIYAKGYQNTSIDDILATTNVTKGAFYYHFKNKDEMGLAIINDLMKPALSSSFIDVLRDDTDPVKAIYGVMKHLLLENELLKVEFGCPASNFTQEMAPWHNDFSKALNEITDQWSNLIEAAIDKGKKSGQIARSVNSKNVAMFVVSGYWGVRNMGKLTNSTGPYQAYLKELKKYLESLR